MNALLDAPRLESVLVVPHGFSKAAQFEVNVTVESNAVERPFA